MCRYLCLKQKTAYEMRISDWSSDVCSSDLRRPLPVAFDDHRETAGGRHAMEIDGARPMAVPGIAIYADTDAIAFHDRLGAGQPILPGNGNYVEPNFDRRVTRGLLRGAVEAERPGALEFEATACPASVTKIGR